MSRRARWAMALILAGGLALRVWYADDGKEFFDERHTLKNVQAMVAQGRDAPVQYVYPPFSYMAQVRVLQMLEKFSPGSMTNGPLLSSRAVLIHRLYVVLWGIGIVLLAAALTRFLPHRHRPPPAPAPQFAALVLAFSPLMIRQSVFAKPDMQAVFLATAAALLALFALRDVESGKARRAWRTWLPASGILAGLAIATKASMAAAAGPALALAALRSGGLKKKVESTIVVVVTMVGAFFLATPRWQGVFKGLAQMRKDYAFKAGLREQDGGSIFQLLLDWPGDRYVLGPWFCALAVAAAVGIVVLAWRDGPTARRRLAVFAAFPAGYFVSHAVAVDLAKDNTLIPLLPWAAACGGWLLAAVLARVAGVLGARRSVATVVLTLVAAVAIVEPGWTYTYRWLVPTTHDAAERWLRDRMKRTLEGRVFALETPPDNRPRWQHRNRAWPTATALVPRDELQGAVAVEKTDGGTETIEAPDPASVETDGPVFVPRWFHLRGPAAAPRVHPWRRQGSLRGTALLHSESDGTIEYRAGAIPEGKDSIGRFVSVLIRLPRGGPAARSIRGCGPAHPFQWAGLSRRARYFLSQRFPTPQARCELVIATAPRPGEPEPEIRPEVPIKFYGWAGPTPPRTPTR